MAGIPHGENNTPLAIAPASASAHDFFLIVKIPAMIANVPKRR